MALSKRVSDNHGGHMATDTRRCFDPNCREGVAGPDEQPCATCGGMGYLVADEADDGQPLLLNVGTEPATVVRRDA